MLAFFFSSRRRHTRYIGDWSSDVCSSDLIPMAYARLSETYGPSTRLDLPGLGLVSGGLLAVVWGLVRANELGWTSATIVRSEERRVGKGCGVRAWSVQLIVKDYQSGV